MRRKLQLGKPYGCCKGRALTQNLRFGPDLPYRARHQSACPFLYPPGEGATHLLPGGGRSFSRLSAMTTDWRCYSGINPRCGLGQSRLSYGISGMAESAPVDLEGTIDCTAIWQQPLWVMRMCFFLDHPVMVYPPPTKCPIIQQLFHRSGIGPRRIQVILLLWTKPLPGRERLSA